MDAKWEYLTLTLEAKVTKQNRDQLKQRFGDKKKLGKFAPESMIPELDELGNQGWELVHMEPVPHVGGKGNIFFTGAGGRWSNSYFCVFKRQKSSLSRPMPQPEPQASASILPEE